jgi:hypothetical protein
MTGSFAPTATVADGEEAGVEVGTRDGVDTGAEVCRGRW